MGNGKIIMGTNLISLLAYAGIMRETLVDNGIKFVRRESKTGFYYFINNQLDRSFEGWLPLSVKASSAALFNPMTEKTGNSTNEDLRDGELELFMKLECRRIDDY